MMLTDRLILTEENYYGKEANEAYFSVSQYKDFVKCPAMAMAKINGEYTQERTRALILGSYVDEMLTGTAESLAEFIEQNRADLFKRNGEPLADVLQADKAIARVRQQPLMMKYLNAHHQVIATGEIEGVPFKGKFDSYAPGEFIADLKYLKSLRSPNLFQNIVDHYRYDLQGAVYRELVRQQTGETLPFYLVIATKESPARLAVCEINSYNLDKALDEVKRNIERFQRIKQGELPAERCEEVTCDYCAGSKILTESIDHELLGLSTAQLRTMNGVI